MISVNFFEMAMQIINFLILLFILQKLAYKPLMSFISQRQKLIEDQIEKNKQAGAAAEAQLKTVNAMLSSAKQDVQNIRKQGETAAKEEVQRLLQKTKAEAELMITDARAELHREIEKAKIALVDEVGQLAVNVAEKVLEKEIKPVSIQSYVDELAPAFLKTQRSQS